MKIIPHKSIAQIAINYFVLFGFASSFSAFCEEISTIPPRGIDPSDWSSICSAYEAGHYAIEPQNDGLFTARNPGQQWVSEFDGKGFTIKPETGNWTWGLELTDYNSKNITEFGIPLGDEHDFHTETLKHGKLSFSRDHNLTEWFLNNTQGLEQGWTFKQRPNQLNPGEPLRLSFAVRGNLRPKISAGAKLIDFVTDDSNSVLSYGGLKAWDSTGRQLQVRFEEKFGRNFSLVVEDQNARYPVMIDPIMQQAYIKASNSNYQSRFGDKVAISGDTVVVGAYSEDGSSTGINGNQSIFGAPASGAVYIFVRSGTSWTQQAYVKASNTNIDDYFGSAVAISGDTLVVGAATEDSCATGINGDQSDNSCGDSGAVYIFVRNGTTWHQQAYVKASNTGGNDRFGATVGISGNTVVIGALREDSSAIGVNGEQADESSEESGAAYVFVRDGTSWSQQAFLKASNSEAGDLFGHSTEISGDTVVVTALYEDSSTAGVNGNETDNNAEESGAAYVFVRSGSTWSQQAYLKASNNAESASLHFGFSVACSSDTIVVGATQENSGATGVNGDQSSNSASSSGAAYVFVRSDNNWSQQAYLKASNTESYDSFGYSVAINGNTLLVGAPEEASDSNGVNGDQSNNNARSSGATYLFSRAGTTWSQRAYLKASNSEGSDSFGESVAVGCNYVIIGAPGEQSEATGINGNQNNNGASNVGAGYFFSVSSIDFTNAMTGASLFGENALFTADPDNDGLANGLEWILGGNPTISSFENSPFMTLTNNEVSFTFSRLDLSECSTRLVLQWSSNLVVWQEIPIPLTSSANVIISENGTMPDTVVVNLPRSNEVSGKLFLRLAAVNTAGE